MITAQEIQIGQTIKYANQWGIVIEKPKFSASGKGVSIKVITLPSNVRRSNGHVSQCEGGYITEFFYRPTTKVNTK